MVVDTTKTIKHSTILPNSPTSCFFFFFFFFFFRFLPGVSLIRVQGPDFFKTKKKICTPSKICVGKKKFAPNTGWV